MATEAYELVISGTLAGQFVQNVFHVNVNNVGSTNPYTEAKDILSTLENTLDFWTFWTNILPGDYKTTSARCRKVISSGGPTAIMLASEMAEATGQRSGSIQAAQVNPVIVWLTTQRPNHPGRTFLPGLSETDCDDMVIVSGLIAAFEAFIDLIVTPFTLDGTSDPSSFGIYRRALAASDDIMAGRVSPLIGTQRRRLVPV